MLTATIITARPMEIPATAMRTIGRVPEIVLELSRSFLARIMREAIKYSGFKEIIIQRD